MLRSLQKQEGSKPAPGPFPIRGSPLHQEPSLKVLGIHNVEKVGPDPSPGNLSSPAPPDDFERAVPPASLNTFHSSPKCSRAQRCDLHWLS